MEDPRVQTRCKFYNCGFCKFGDKCRFAHFQTNCFKTNCKNKDSRNMHPKCCRYKEECKDENEDLRTKINEMKDKLDEANANLEMHVKEVETLQKLKMLKLKQLTKKH